MGAYRACRGWRDAWLGLFAGRHRNKSLQRRRSYRPLRWELLEDRTLLATEVIRPTPVSQSAGPSSPVGIDVMYSTADPADETLTGLGLRLHFSSAQLTFGSLSNVLATGLIIQGSPQADTSNFDGDGSTNMFVNVAWADFSGNWPGNGTTPLRLYTANCTTSAGFTGSTALNFSASSLAAGRTLDAQSATIAAPPPPGVTVTPTSGLVTTEAGGTATFTAALTAMPTANVTIALSSSDTTEGAVSPASLTFTSANWNVPQTVTVTGVDDLLNDGGIGYTIVTGVTTSTDVNFQGLPVADVSVTNTDNDSVVQDSLQ